MHDVAVVGGGPAGATLARLLAAAGAGVVLLERERLPRYKPCGGGLTQRSLALLPEAARSVVRAWCPGALVVHGRHHLHLRTPRPAVAMVMRDELDHCLVRLAADAGALVRDGAPVSAVRLLPEGVELVAGGEPVRAKYLACADGSTGPFSGPLGVAAGLPAVPPRIGALEVEIEDPGAAWGNELRGDFDVIPGGYAWVFPKAGLLSVGVASWRRGSGGSLLRERLRFYLARLGLQDRRVLRSHGHPIPVGGRLAPAALASDRVLRLGDAAGLADPLFGEGIAYALRSAHLAVRPLLAGDLAAYRDAVAAGIFRTFRAAARVGSAFYAAPQPWFLAARAWPGLGDRFFTLAVRGG